MKPLTWVPTRETSLKALTFYPPKRNCWHSLAPQVVNWIASQTGPSKLQSMFTIRRLNSPACSQTIRSSPHTRGTVGRRLSPHSARRDQSQLCETHLVQHLITRPFPHRQRSPSFKMTSGITGELDMKPGRASQRVGGRAFSLTDLSLSLILKGPSKAGQVGLWRAPRSSFHRKSILIIIIFC